MMIAADPIPPVLDAPLADEQHAAIVDGLGQDYLGRALRALRVRHALNAAIIAGLEGREGTLEDLTACVAAHDVATREAGEALVVLGHLINCQGVC